MKVDVPQSDLFYKCLIEGKELSKSTTVLKVLIPQETKPEPNTYEMKPMQFSATDSNSETQAKKKSEEKKKVKESANNAKDKAKKGLGFMRLVSGILATLGSLIPGSVGGSLKEKSGEIQKVSQDASTKIQMPEQKLKSVEHLKGQVNQITPGAKDKKSIPAKVQTSETNQIQSVSNNNILEPAPDSLTNRLQVREVSYSDYLETPSLSPGKSFCLEILLDPVRPYRSGKYYIEVIIRQIQSFNDLLSEDQAVTNSGLNISVNGLSPVFWILSFVMVLSAIVINVTWAVFFINWLARFVI
ncbi:MAG: hypothetical protein Q7U53_11885 [Anaerolineaceae bacterium]|nr:hypothetical protein [Anaerolineaceae bacterium]